MEYESVCGAWMEMEVTEEQRKGRQAVTLREER